MAGVKDKLEARKTNRHISFEDWLHFLDSAALTIGFKYRIAQAGGAECWWEYYDDGLTPYEALCEDLLCAV